MADEPPPPSDDRGDDACEICGGRGWYTPEVPVGHPDFGQALTCRCQQQRFSMERLDRLLQYSNLGHLTRFTFAALNPDGIAADADSRSMFAHACRIAAEYAENPDGWLVLAGPNGSGKTHLAAAIANHRIKAGQVVFFMHVPDLLDHLRATYSPTSELTYSDLYNQVVDAPLLILDGIGAHSSTPWAQEKLQQIVNHRFNAELPTIVTTASDLADLDPYISSRLESAGRVAHTRKRQPTRTHGLGRIPDSNLGHLTRFTFAALNPDGIAADADSRSMFAHACRIAAEYAENPDGWLVLAGPNGSGKTHLAAAIANHRIKAGQVVFFMHVPDLLDHLRATYSPTSELTYSDLYAQVVDAPLLILDGIGAHSSTPWAQEKLQQIVNHRFNAELPTIVTTASDLADLDPYIRSRLESAGRVAHTRKRQPTRTHGLGRIPTAMQQRMSFETFDARGNNPTAGQRNSLEFALGAARNFASDPDGWLTLFGKTGVGKTHLAVAIGNECLSKGRQMFFAIVPDLLDYLRSAYAPNSPTRYDTIFEEITNTPLLILDDLGRENSSPWAQEKLYQIIVHRHNSRLPTVITSMLDFTEQSGPIGSRIRDASLVQLIRIDAPDWRIRVPR